MAKGEIKRVVFYLLPIIGLVILASIFFGVLYPKAAGETRKGILGAVDKFIGKETIKAGEVVVEKSHLQAINQLKLAIERMRNSSDAECYSSYQSGAGSNNNNNGLPSLGEKGTTITLEAVSSGMRVVIIGGAEGLQEHSSETIKDVTPCVISGGSVPRNFYDKFVSGQQAGNYFTPANKIKISYNTDGANENRISYDNSEFLDFEDGGLLFKAGRNICFFPTVDDKFDPFGVCDGDSAEGLDDDCLGAEKEIISLSKGKLKMCGTEPKLVPPKLGP